MKTGTQQETFVVRHANKTMWVVRESFAEQLEKEVEELARALALTLDENAKLRQQIEGK